MIISSTQYIADNSNTNIGIAAVIDNDNVNVPLDPANRHYAEIMRQVDAGELTIADAD